MCDCIKDIETRLKAEIPAGKDMGTMKPKDAELISLRCENMAFMMPGFVMKLNIPYKATWKVKGKLRETRIPIVASHCPFCGKEIL